MRKTRLVILPTKCLHQMGFLLLFLSCPVIGDWGRIRPESENSHNAIQIDREGSCGMERDPPGGLLGFLNEDGSKQCQLSENHDMNSFIERTISRKTLERRLNARRIDQLRNTRVSERRVTDGRNVRTIQRGVEDIRDIRREPQTGIKRNVRSRSAESRLSSNRNNLRVRSLSLYPVENERVLRERKSVVRNVRQDSERNSRKENEKLYLNRRTNERQSFKRRLSREPIESERSTRIVPERKENERAFQYVRERRDIKRFSRSSERERQEVRRESSRRSIQERRENQRDAVRRLSLARRELNEARRNDRFDNKKSARRENVPETRNTQRLEFKKSKTEEREINSDRSRFYNRRATENRRSVSLPPKLFERNNREHRMNILKEKVEEKSMSVVAASVRRNPHDLLELKLENKNTDDKTIFGGITEWMDIKTFEGVKAGDWTTNCVVGAVVYFLTTRQIKTV